MAIAGDNPVLKIDANDERRRAAGAAEDVRALTRGSRRAGG